MQLLLLLALLWTLLVPAYRLATVQAEPEPVWHTVKVITKAQARVFIHREGRTR